jgi:hypothetical protein
MENKDKIEEILNSLDGINQAKANPFMFTRIMASYTVAEDLEPVKPILIVKYAAIVLALLAINVWAINRYMSSGNEDTNKSSVTEIAGEYGLNDNTTNY